MTSTIIKWCPVCQRKIGLATPRVHPVACTATLCGLLASLSPAMAATPMPTATLWAAMQARITARGGGGFCRAKATAQLKRSFSRVKVTTAPSMARRWQWAWAGLK